MSTYNEKVNEFYNSQALNQKQKSLQETEDEKKKAFLEDVRNTQQQIDEIKNKYVIKLETKPIEKLTEKQLLQNAENEVNSSYDKKIEDLTTSSNEKIEKLNKANDKAVLKGEVNKAEIEKTYKVLDKKAENDAIKNGIQRSSIIAEKIKTLSKSKIQDMLSVDEEVANTLYENNAQITKLEDEYKKSINNLETSRAVAIKEKLNDLIEKQDKKIVDILNYNTAIKKEEERQNAELQNLYSIEGKAQVDKLEQQKTSYALNYFLNIPKEQAYKELEEDEIKNLLGEANLKIIKSYLESM
jgi:hypothetical protein